MGENVGKDSREKEEVAFEGRVKRRQEEEFFSLENKRCVKAQSDPKAEQAQCQQKLGGNKCRNL